MVEVVRGGIESVDPGQMEAAKSIGMTHGQAMMHIMVNLDIGFRTGQTLPLISDGRFAFIMFCSAFGVILSLSKSADQGVESEEQTQA